MQFRSVRGALVTVVLCGSRKDQRGTLSTSSPNVQPDVYFGIKESISSYSCREIKTEERRGAKVAESEGEGSGKRASRLGMTQS